MKKILLAGLTTAYLGDVKCTLEQTFKVTNCQPILQNVQGMMRIVKPDLIVYVIETELDETMIEKESVSAILRWLHEHCAGTPVLVICSEKNCQAIKTVCALEDYVNMGPEDVSEALTEQCMLMAGTDSEVPEQDQNKARDYVRKVLIVDDSAIALRNFNALVKEKYQTVLATSGEQALKQLEVTHPDMVLLDYEMPGMNGIETFQRMREMHEGKDIPIIFLTSVSEKDRVIQILSNHPDGYILKPPDHEKLLQTIEDVFQKREQKKNED